MTGFGAASREVDGLGLEVEARSVNHRHLDLRIRLPKLLSDQEARLKKRIQKRLERGKVDISVNLVASAGESALEIDETIAAQYVAAAETLRARHGLTAELDVAALLGLSGVTRLVETPIDPQSLVGPVEEALDEAVEAMIVMRASEGETLAADFDGRLTQIVTSPIASRHVQGRSWRSPSCDSRNAPSKSDKKSAFSTMHACTKKSSWRRTASISRKNSFGFAVMSINFARP
jgi:uncharacterized protein (TIGR00255 family)